MVEIERSNQAEALLDAGDIKNFGRLMNECHASLRDLYEVSCLELNAMVDIAQSIEGCYGARLTGAGLGGVLGESGGKRKRRRVRAETGEEL